MYRTQTRREMTRDALLVAFLPALIMGGFLVGTFRFVAHTEGFPPAYPWGFIGLFVGLTLCAGVFSAVTGFLGGPGMVPMSPAEEAAKRAEIEADVAARIRAAEYAREDALLWGTPEERENRFHTWGVTR